MTRVFITTHGGGHIGNEIAPITEEEEVIMLPTGIISQESDKDLQLYDELPVLLPTQFNAATKTKSDGI